jgi:cell division septation protein DedD
MNITNACTLAVEGETDKFCVTAEENDLTDKVSDPPFPVVLCHSPQDELIPYALAPNASSSENLTEFNLFGITASGSHAEAALFCFFPMVLPFTVYSMGPSAIEQVPIESCAAAPTDAPGATPTEAPPPTEGPGTPTEAPPPTEARPTMQTSTGYRGSTSFFIVALVSFVWNVVTWY